ncbi:bifunctional glutamate N-acetyltransferase/amino-acid acetyltransferase ArgJ [Rubripirellula sp.]|nr:bifunctional glutamate N-acetyltransferase/amino-acid acetyltransferase ArgJ [Rubripirellula sp.]MDB4339018.1 bifunctional glutamate N-acetyltransferase/amino-acid acetyltransferase ArgJ [Rubripirellula sp.]
MNPSDQPSSSSPLPGGFRYSGTACGLKASGRKDLSLVVADHAVVAAGVYTQNQIVAAPVINCRSKTPSRSIRAVVTNSGNANACTGEQGQHDANKMCELVADVLDCDPSQVLVMSTGVIGVPLAMEEISKGIHAANLELNQTTEDFQHAADAICTTDQSRKTASRQFDVDGKTVHITGMAKGAGMIAPNMATMLALITTDASLSEEEAEACLKTACKESFNRISVDGHTSTNDTVILLASGDSKVAIGKSSLEIFQRALNSLFTELAKLIVADGEGATHVMAIEIIGAVNDDQAFEIAKTVAASPLVKTAITGGDPNWGRIVSAAGYAQAEITPDAATLKICGETIYQNGTPLPFDAATLSQKMKANVEVPIQLRVGLGNGHSNYWSSDLTTDYVRFNSEYTT